VDSCDSPVWSREAGSGLRTWGAGEAEGTRDVEPMVGAVEVVGRGLVVD
jgi:hypothetical protein